MFDQKIIDWTIKQWCPRLQASFENKEDILTGLTSRTLGRTVFLSLIGFALVFSFSFSAAF